MAYQAADTLLRVLDRIPRSVFDQFDCEVLVIDDASSDATYALGQAYRESNPHLPLTVLRNRYNQGYGGNQKIGYSYAIEHGFDLVALIHGDGQYAPEELPNLLSPFGADQPPAAVMGSRMMVRGAARSGGMPLYKYVGNRILTRTQNLLLHTRFTEFHSGYRIYSVGALKRIHFELDTSEFHFDTEVILQLLAANEEVVELPIPTYYGDEISRVNGLEYAANVLRVTLQYRLHSMGLRQQRRFDPKDLGNQHYQVKLGYPSSHQWALDRVRPGSAVLDLGAGPGGLAAILAENGCQVAVVDQYPPVEEVHGVQVFVQDLEEPPRYPTDADYILLLDVIEHLKEPEVFLERLRSTFDHRPRTLVLTTPNVAFLVTRTALLFGQFNYGKSGILDRTHTRLFTFRSVRHLLRDAGFQIEELRGVPAPIPLAIGDTSLARLLLRVNLLLIRISRSLFSFQILAVARSTPDLRYLLGDARQVPPVAEE